MKKDRSFFGLTVKAVVVNDKNEVLLVKRAKDSHSGGGKLDLPGGKLEIGENIKTGLVREIKEETGIEVDLGPILYAFDFGEKYDREHEIGDEKLLVGGKGLRYLAYYKEGNVKLSGEHEEWEWVGLAEALQKFGDDEFEKDKKVSIKRAQEYLDMKEALDGWKRCLADFENYKKRQAENQREMAAYSNLNLILELLPVVDNFEASVAHVPEGKSDNGWVTGIMHIQKQLEKVLEDNGVEEIRIKEGDEFDPTVMEAIKKEEGEGKVGKVLVKGYKMGGKIIRAAKVVVE